MSRSNTHAVDSVQWVPAERLGQLSMEPQLRPWLIGQGLLTLRLKAAYGARYALRVLDLWTGVLRAAHKTVLRSADDAALFVDVELCCDDKVWVFGQTVVPDSTLDLHPWLAELGETALGETLSELSGVERSAYEYAWLPATDPVTMRALRNADVKPAGLWARRSRITLRNAPLLVQELFLPAMGRT